MRTSRAFTLVELLIALAVAAVLITLAAPSFRDFILMQRLKGIHAQLVTDLQFARSEAISRGVEVNVSVQTMGRDYLPGSCYIIFIDTARDYKKLGASARCSCRALAADSRCTATGTKEIRTVSIPAEAGVALSIPSDQTTAVAFDPVTGGMVLTISETGVGTGNEFTVYSAIDAPRMLAAVVGLSGRPTVCKPKESTMNERDC